MNPPPPQPPISSPGKKKKKGKDKELAARNNWTMIGGGVKIVVSEDSPSPPQPPPEIIGASGCSKQLPKQDLYLLSRILKPMPFPPTEILGTNAIDGGGTAAPSSPIDVSGGEEIDGGDEIDAEMNSPPPPERIRASGSSKQPTKQDLYIGRLLRPIPFPPTEILGEEIDGEMNPLPAPISSPGKKKGKDNRSEKIVIPDSPSPPPPAPEERPKQDLNVLRHLLRPMPFPPPGRILPRSLLRPPSPVRLGKRGPSTFPSTIRHVVESYPVAPSAAEIMERLQDVDILDVARMKGIVFENPKWWRPGGYGP